MYRNLPNLLSVLRLLMAPFVLVIPRSFLFPFLCFAGLTDILDGFLARKLHAFSRLGAILDPLADKILALFCAYLFFTEGSLSPFSLVALFTRDLSVLIFTCYLFFSGKWSQWTIQSFFCGKVSTCLQIIVFSLLALTWDVPSFLYLALLGFGALSFLELLFLRA